MARNATIDTLFGGMSLVVSELIREAANILDYGCKPEKKLLCVAYVVF